MTDRPGTAVSVAASLAIVVVLLWPYAVRPASAIDTYYESGLLNPLFAGVLAVGVIAAFAALRRDAVSPALGVGIALGLSVFAVLAVLLWAVTARVDVFRAPGWAFPAQRWVLVVLAALAAIGAAWEVRSSVVLTDGR